MLAGETGEQLLVQVREEAGEAAAIHNDGVADLVPERPVEIAGRDAEVSADIDDDGAHGAAAHLGGDLLFRGEVRETWVFGGVRWLGVGRRDLPHGARPACDGQANRRRRKVLAACGAPAKPDFERRRPAQAAGDAGEDDREVGGAKGAGEQGESWGRGALLNVLASCLP